MDVEQMKADLGPGAVFDISSLSEGLTNSQKRIVRATTENLIRNIKKYQQR